MKTFPPHFKANKFQKGDESSIALIITLCILSLLLVLVLAFASVTRVEVETATANRDLVASKFIAQAALERAIADLEVAYVGNNNLTNIGVAGTFSQISPSSLTINVGGFSTNFMTDIEHIIINPVTGQGNTINGADGIIDYVALPNAFTNFTSGITPQWIGLKDTNGNLIGRIAFISSGGSLCVNAVGNMDSNLVAASGLTKNSRNQGVSPAEVNMVAALVAMGWSYANATNDVREIVNYRYGPDGQPGTTLVDDNSNTANGATDKIDNDGDGLIDNLVGEATDEPQEVLAASDQTNVTSITPAGDDRVLTDLKELYQNAAFSAAMKARFSANFTAVQQFFCTQSPVLMDPNLINLMATNFLNKPSVLFDSLTNRLNLVNAFNDYKTQQVQVAANIVSFHDTNSIAPFATNWSGGYVVGVGEVPHLNEIVYQVVATSKRVLGAGPVTNLSVDLSVTMSAEVWYPYTNAFPRASIAATYPVDLLMTGMVGAVSPAAAFPAGFSTNLFGGSVVSWFNTFAAATVATTTNATQFKTNGISYTMNSAVFNGWSNLFTSPITITLSNFNIGAVLRQNAAPNATLDYWPNMIATNAITFSNFELTNGLVGLPQTKTVTGWISFALNDPRVKPSNLTSLANSLEFSGNTGLVTLASSLGTRNATNSMISGVSLALYNPTGTNCDDYAAAGAGITNKTFYVPKYGTWRSVTELGRVHRGYPWQTIDFKGNGRDGFLLDNFTTWKPTTPAGATNYLHGRVNVNTDKSQFPVWAGLFAGMPIWSGTNWVDYTAAGCSSAMPQTSNLVEAMTSAKYPRYEALLSAAYLSNMRGKYGNTWPVQASDEQKEWILDHTFDLMSTRGAGNFFTIWAWGQALKGGALSPTNKVTAAETLIVAMVKVDPTATGTNMKIVYFRYNPDLEFISSPFLDPGPED